MFANNEKGIICIYNDLLFNRISAFFVLNRFCIAQYKDNDHSLQFVPKEFQDVKLGLYETLPNNCTPVFSEGYTPINSIRINTPEKIIFKLKDKNNIPVIPICVVYDISLRRGLKYNHLSAKIIHIRKVIDEKEYIVEIRDKDLKYEYPILPPNSEEDDKELEKEIEDAKKYNKNELNEGLSGGGYMNLNLFNYVDIPFQPGKYEIYLSFSGLESNHEIVEIVFE